MANVEQIRFSDLQGLEGDIQVQCISNTSGPSLKVKVSKDSDCQEMTFGPAQIRRLKEIGFKFYSKRDGEIELCVSPNKQGTFDCCMTKSNSTQKIPNFGGCSDDYFTFFGSRIGTASLEHRAPSNPEALQATKAVNTPTLHSAQR